MIQILDKHNCCGCESCVQVCPKHCIGFVQDREGFYYPEVDDSLCISCRLCEKVCPVINQGEERSPYKALASFNRDDKARESSSSGGIFSLLSEKVLDEGGVVFGARFDENWQVVIDAAETKETIKAFIGSKYLQAKVGESFRNCKRYLDEGRKVLFAGTPCQISGLRLFLRRQYENLLAVDIVCHGVPSPLVWERYVDENVQAAGEIERINFRDKVKGWKLFSLTFVHDSNGQLKSRSTSFKEDLYMQAFLKNLILRPSCYVCPAKCGKSHSDITLADFWGIGDVNPQMDDDRGTSLVLINTKRGLLSLPLDRIVFTEEDFSASIKKNSAWNKSAVPHFRRAEFFEGLSKGKILSLLISHSLRPSIMQRIAQFKHPLTIMRKLKNRVKH